MQNYTFPFNQKQHIFDFKVKVNFQNGNVSLTAPQIISPPAFFNNLASNNQNVQRSNYPISNLQNHQNNMMYNQPIQQIPINLNPIISGNNPQFTNNSYPIQNKNQQIEMVYSSYTSLKEGENQFSISNNSLEMIECVICQKTFYANELQHHLELHRNRVSKNNVSNFKGNVSNYALTQNSLNGGNDSVLSEQRSNSSYQNQNSFNQSFQEANHKNSSFITSNNIQNQNNNQNQRMKIQNHPQLINQPNSQYHQSFNNNNQNDNIPLLGRIQNPILAIKNQQSSLSQSYSSHPNQSLNYSNSDGQQSTTRFNHPFVSNPNDQSPQFHNPKSNNSSFGNAPGNNMIGPSFYQNSSHQSVNHANNGPFFKGVNRLAYNQSQGSFHGQVPLINNPLAMHNQSNHSYHSNDPNNFPHGSHQNSNQFIPATIDFQNGSLQNINSSNNFSNLRNSVQSIHSSFRSNGSLHNNFVPSSNSNPVFHNFQTIESRYMNQRESNSRQLYASHQQISNFHQSRKKKTISNQDVPFSESDISSISYQSRADQSQYSDWSDLHPKSQPKLQGYNSADNSIIKNMQKHQKNYANNSRKNKNQNQNTEANFFKKKKDFMISSAASYYEKKFKDQESSSEQQDNVYKSGRLSYAERLKQKRMSDNMKSLAMSQTKSVNKLKHSQRSNKSNNLSKCSEDSNMSKTKLPVNYLARQEFISTSSTSKSTHKTSIPN